MISTAWRFIFLHAPKTGGNSMQLLLQPHSDDRLVSKGWRDGTHRFGVRGPVTPGKHATLQHYADGLNGDLDAWRVALTARDPIERAVSHYFSPHRWTEPDGAGGWRLKTPTWDLQAFLSTLGELTPLTRFVTVDGVVRRPHHLIRQERLADDFAAFVRAVGVPVDPSALPWVNRSAAKPGVREAAMADPEVRTAVISNFAADYEMLEAFGGDRAG